MLRQLRPAIVSLLLLTLLTGVAYPLLITGVAHVLFPWQAKGSLLLLNGKPVGSVLIGQPFDDPRYFWSRPSATAPMPYNAAASGGSNLSPANPAFVEAVNVRLAALHAVDPTNDRPIPIDLLTASASGLDPHISPAAAEYQISRIARLRHIPDNELRRLVAQHTSTRDFGLLGEPRVTVLELNLALDGMTPSNHGGR